MFLWSDRTVRSTSVHWHHPASLTATPKCSRYIVFFFFPLYYWCRVGVFILCVIAAVGAATYVTKGACHLKLDKFIMVFLLCLYFTFGMNSGK